MKPSWKKLASRLIHKNPYFFITEDYVIRPDGRPGKYYVINAKHSVMVIAEDSDSRIFLVGQTRYAIGNRYSWEVPGGSIEKGLTPLQAARRELKEEAGITAKKWISLGYFHPSTGLNSEICHVFLARDLIMGDAEPDATEDITVKKYTLAKILKMTQTKQITHGFTLSAIIKYLVYKN